MAHPLDYDRINVQLDPGPDGIFLDIGHWFRYQWCKCKELNCEIPVSNIDYCTGMSPEDLKKVNRFYLSSEELQPYLKCEELFFRPYVRFQINDFIPTSEKCNWERGEQQIQYWTYHNCGAKSQALSQVFMCKMRQKMGWISAKRRCRTCFDTQALRYTNMRSGGFSSIQTVTDGFYCVRQDLIFSGKRPLYTELTPCQNPPESP